MRTHQEFSCRSPSNTGNIWRPADEKNQDRVFAAKSLVVWEVSPVEFINKVLIKFHNN